MKQADGWLVRASTLVATSLLVACGGLAPRTYNQTGTPNRPGNVAESRAFVQKTLLSAKAYKLSTSSWRKTQSVRLTPTHLSVTTDDGATKTIALNDVAISSTRDRSGGSITVAGGGFYNAARPDLYLLAELKDYSPTNLQRMVDALGVLNQAALDIDRENESRFQVIATAYRETTTKPTISEEVRRLKLQAEGAYRERDFLAAAALYERATTIAPWWAEGYFNRALTLSGAAAVGAPENYKPAIVSMKRYLALEPGARDARAAQDNIYDWERKLQNMPRSAEPDFQRPDHGQKARQGILVVVLTLGIGAAAIMYGLAKAEEQQQ